MNQKTGLTKAKSAVAKGKFLTVFIDTLDYRVAAKKAGVSESTGYRWAKQYSNVVEAQFENNAGLSRSDVLKIHAGLIMEPPKKIHIDKQGEVYEEVNENAHLKAIDMYYEVSGIKKTTPEIVVINDNSEQTINDTKVYNILTDDQKAELREKMLKGGK